MEDLQFEELRQIWLDSKKVAEQTQEKIQLLLESYEKPHAIQKVEGRLEVNTEKNVNVENLHALKGYFENISEQISKTIENNSHKPLSEIKVLNFPEPPKNIDIKNADAITRPIIEAINKIDTAPEVIVQKQDIQFPTTPRNPISVRLSDGKSFYNAISQAVAGIASYVNAEGKGTQVQLTSTGRVPVELGLSPTIDIGDIQIKDTTDTVINPATKEKQQEQIDLMKCIVTPDASTTTALNNGQTYTGNWIDFLPWNAAIITLVTNADSTLYIEYSHDGTNVLSTLTRQEAITATQSGAFVAGRRANYFRIRLTANANQSSLNLQTILSARPVQMDAQPIEDPITSKYIAETVRSILTAKKPNGDYINIDATAGGNLKVSLEEVDGGAVVPVTQETSTTGTSSTASVTNANTTVLASNTSRKGATIYNEGTVDCFVKLGSTASLTTYTIKIIVDGYYELPFNYTGIITGITASGTATLRVTELT